MHGRLIWAYQNDNIVHACLDAGVDLEAIIDHLARERAKLFDRLVKVQQTQPLPMLYIREPDGRITPATSLETTPAADPTEPAPIRDPTGPG